jgi:hypothetical protein
VIVLDTNVLSELTRREPDPRVLAWADSLPSGEAATTAVTAAELLYGVARLPRGRRKTQLRGAVRGLLDEDLHGRVEPFDAASAEHYGDIVAGRDKLGRPITVADALIAAVCRARRATLATRNTSDFEQTGIDLVNPWWGRLGRGGQRT